MDCEEIDNLTTVNKVKLHGIDSFF